MLNSTQSTTTIAPTQPTVLPDMPLDPANPLVWILVLATLLTATEKPLNAIANLLRAWAAFLKSRRNQGQ